MSSILDFMDTSSLSPNELNELKNLKPEFELLKSFLEKRNDYPDPQKEISGNIFEMNFNQIYLDEQIIILKIFLNKNPNAIRALKIIGLRYFWTKENIFIDNSINCLLKYAELSTNENLDGVYEILGSAFLLKNENQKANIYFQKSNRMNISNILNSYGSLLNFANEHLNNKKGLRFKDFYSGKFQKNELNF